MGLRAASLVVVALVDAPRPHVPRAPAVAARRRPKQRAVPLSHLAHERKHALAAARQVRRDLLHHVPRHRAPRLGRRHLRAAGEACVPGLGGACMLRPAQ
eukprot:366271-Chlamydomonas_euryale.AAC.1